MTSPRTTPPGWNLLECCSSLLWAVDHWVLSHHPLVRSWSRFSYGTLSQLVLLSGSAIMSILCFVMKCRRCVYFSSASVSVGNPPMFCTYTRTCVSFFPVNGSPQLPANRSRSGTPITCLLLVHACPPPSAFLPLPSCRGPSLFTSAGSRTIGAGGVSPYFGCPVFGPPGEACALLVEVEIWFA